MTERESFEYQRFAKAMGTYREPEHIDTCPECHDKATGIEMIDPPGSDLDEELYPGYTRRDDEEAFSYYRSDDA